MHKPLQNVFIKFNKPITNSFTLLLRTEDGEQTDPTQLSETLHAVDIIMLTYGMKPPSNFFLAIMFLFRRPFRQNYFISTHFVVVANKKGSPLPSAPPFREMCPVDIARGDTSAAFATRIRFI